MELPSSRPRWTPQDGIVPSVGSVRWVLEVATNERYRSREVFRSSKDWDAQVEARLRIASCLRGMQRETHRRHQHIQIVSWMLGWQGLVSSTAVEPSTSQACRSNGHATISSGLCKKQRGHWLGGEGHGTPEDDANRARILTSIWIFLEEQRGC